MTQRALLSSKLLEIGKALLKRHLQEGSAAKLAQESVNWIQQAYAIVEQLEESSNPGMAELKVSLTIIMYDTKV